MVIIETNISTKKIHGVLKAAMKLLKRFCCAVIKHSDVEKSLINV